MVIRQIINKFTINRHLALSNKNINMNNSNTHLAHLFAIRNRYDKQVASKKMSLLNELNRETHKSKKTVQSYYAILLFLIAHPDNKTVYRLAQQLLQQLELYITANEKIKRGLFNTGITGSTLCSAFSFEMVKWLRQTRPREIRFSSFEAGDAQIQSILSAVMPKVESEIMQDANAEWKGWLKQSLKKGEDLLDQLISIFDSSSIRPEVKDELWNAIGINVEIDFVTQCCLPESLIAPYYHRSLIRREIKKISPVTKPCRVKLTNNEAAQIIDCSRMVLVRNLREIDPISFTAPNLISYYRLPGGIAIALMGMVTERRHPIDSYMGYMVFKNGLPVAYAGSWILFNSARIGLNVFPEYRGGESKYIFDQVLQLHAQVYHLKRFTVDPYQLGKENSDGIRSGAFWVYYKAGFRPIQMEQRELAAAEEQQIRSVTGYRSSAAVLKKLAGSRMELILQKNAVRFDATDMSRAYAATLIKKYRANRILAEKETVKKLAKILNIKDYHEINLSFVLKNWALLLLYYEKKLQQNSGLRIALKSILKLKASGAEEMYIKAMQQDQGLRKLVEGMIPEHNSNQLNLSAS